MCPCQRKAHRRRPEQGRRCAVSGRRALGDLPAAYGDVFPAEVDAGDPRRRRTGAGAAGGR
jgi:hypothetical protein